MNTSIDNKIIKLIIKGFVIATPGKLRKKIGQLDSDINTVNFGDIFTGSTQSQKIKIHNTTEDSISIFFSEDYIGVEMQIEPQTILPAAYGKLVLNFDTSNRDLGKLSQKIWLDFEIAGQPQSGEIYLQANILEDFSTLTNLELANPPQIFVQNETLILKGLMSGELRTEIIKIENTGKRDLYIRNIQTSDKKFSIYPAKFIISPGEKSSFTISMKPDKYSSKLKTTITIISNDPNQSVINFTIIGKVDLPEGSSSKYIADDIQIEKAAKIVKSFKGNGKLIILDVRTVEEYSNGCLEDAINIDFYSSDFKKILKILDMGKTYLVYCQSGIRSKKAVDLMSEIGFKNIYHMYEGIEGWKTQRLELVNPK